jgi:integrase
MFHPAVWPRSDMRPLVRDYGTKLNGERYLRGRGTPRYAGGPALHRFLTRRSSGPTRLCAKPGREPIGAITPHSLRCTFISLLLAAGADVPYVMAQADHTDPKMTLGLYAKVIASKTDHGAALDKLVAPVKLRACRREGRHS